MTDWANLIDHAWKLAEAIFVLAIGLAMAINVIRSVWRDK